MPTKRQRRSHRRRQPITPTAVAFLNDKPMPDDGNEWEDSALRYNHAALSADLWQGGCAAVLWAEHGTEVMVAWVKARPGTRPSQWWRFSAPRQADQGHGRRHWPLIETRQHVSGTGTVDDRQNCARYGVPRFDYQSRPPRKPRIIEAQAAYLDRHGLLSGEERRRIPAAAFEPVPIEDAAER